MFHIICHLRNANYMTMSYYYMSIKMTKIQNTTSDAGKGVEQQEHSLIASGNAE